MTAISLISGSGPALPQFKALLMVDEAHSLGMLGKKGTGIEEHFGSTRRPVLLISKWERSANDPEHWRLYRCQLKARQLPEAFHPAIHFFRVASASLGRRSQSRFRGHRRGVLACPKTPGKRHYFLRTLQARGFDTLRSQTAIVRSSPVTRPRL